MCCRAARRRVLGRRGPWEVLLRLPQPAHHPQVSVMNLLLVVLWAFALPYPRFRPMASCLSTVWTCIIIVCKMLYQLKVVSPHEYSSNCTEVRPCGPSPCLPHLGSMVMALGTDAGRPPCLHPPSPCLWPPRPLPIKVGSKADGHMCPWWGVGSPSGWCPAPWSLGSMSSSPVPRIGACPPRPALWEQVLTLPFPSPSPTAPTCRRWRSSSPCYTVGPLTLPTGLGCGRASQT